MRSPGGRSAHPRHRQDRECFSLSHKPEAVSHGEIERSSSLKNASLRSSRRCRAVIRLLTNRLISQYEMSKHLRDRLVYALFRLGGRRAVPEPTALVILMRPSATCGLSVIGSVRVRTF